MDKPQLLESLSNKARDAGYNLEAGCRSDGLMLGYAFALRDSGIATYEETQAIIDSGYQSGIERYREFKQLGPYNPQRQGKRAAKEE